MQQAPRQNPGIAAMLLSVIGVLAYLEYPGLDHEVITGRRKPRSREMAAAQRAARANRSSLNMQGAFRHVLTDLYAFIGTVIAGIIIVATGLTRADAIASLIVVAQPRVSAPDNGNIARQVARQRRPGRWAAAQRRSPGEDRGLAGQQRRVHRLGGQMIHSTRALAPL